MNKLFSWALSIVKKDGIAQTVQKGVKVKTKYGVGYVQGGTIHIRYSSNKKFPRKKGEPKMHKNYKTLSHNLDEVEIL